MHPWRDMPEDKAIDSMNAEMDVWVDELNGLTANQIAKGKNAWDDSGKDWPPVIQEFRNICLAKEKNRFNQDWIPESMRGPEPIPMNKRLESDQAKEEALAMRIRGRDYIKEMRGKLKV